MTGKFSILYKLLIISTVLPISGTVFIKIYPEDIFLHQELIIHNITYYDPELEERYITFKEERHLTWTDTVTYVNIGLDKAGYYAEEIIADPLSVDVLVDKYRSLTKDYVPEVLVRINSRYSTGDLELREDACAAFESMCEAAALENIHLKAVSAYRSYARQDKVYYKKLRKGSSVKDYMIWRDRVSARAGHSEHQTGLAADVGCNEDSSLKISFGNTDAGKWMASNCYTFGFILRYPKEKEFITGYKYEPWHFRYVGVALANKVHASGLTYDEFCARNLRESVNEKFFLQPRQRSFLPRFYPTIGTY